MIMWMFFVFSSWHPTNTLPDTIKGITNEKVVYGNYIKWNLM